MPVEIDSEGIAPKALPEDTSGIGEDGMPLNPKEPAVQFIPQGKDPNNGDAKVELGEVGGVPKFVGLGKEELMKYANDPFWVRLRWILFILFWIIWLAMLVGAIVIIVLAPKCSTVTKGTTNIVKDGPYYQIHLDSFTNNANKLQGLKEKADYIQSLGIKTVIISQVLSTNDFQTVDPALGNMEDFVSAVEALDATGTNVILSMGPNHSSKKNKWFTDNPDYYVLKPTEEVKDSTWKSRLGGPAWSPYRNTNNSYFHQFGEEEPDLNFNNAELVKEMNKVFKFWYNSSKIAGFLISDASYLLDDVSDLSNQNKTINNAGNKKILEDLLDSSTWELGERSPPYALVNVDGISAAQALDAYSSKNIAPIISDLATDLKPQFTAEELKNSLEATQSKFVLRRLSGPSLQRTVDKFGKNRADILSMVTLLIRGEVVVYYGDELGLTSRGGSDSVNKNVGPMEFAITNEQNATQRYFKDLVNIHKSFNQTAENNEEAIKNYATPEGVFAFKRGNHVVVANLGSSPQNVSLTTAFGVTDEGTVLTGTPNPFRASVDRLRAEFVLQPEAGYVLKYGTA